MDHLHVASQRSRLAIAVSTVVALIAALILVVSPSRSLAAEPPGDQIYWGNEFGSGQAVRSGNLDGAAPPRTLFAGRDAVRGRDRSCGREDLLGQLVRRRDHGREPRRLRHRLEPVPRRARGQPLRGGGRSRGRQDLLGQLHRRTRSGSGTWTARGSSLRPCSRSRRRRAPRAGWRSTPRRQDLLDQPVHRPGSGREPGRLGHRLDPVRQGSDVEDNPIGVAIDPRPTRSTGPTSTPVRSGSGTWTASGHRLRPCSAARSPGGLAIDPDGEQDLLGQLAVRRGDPVREPGRDRHPPRPCSAARAPRSSPRF